MSAAKSPVAAKLGPRSNEKLQTRNLLLSDMSRFLDVYDAAIGPLSSNFDSVLQNVLGVIRTSLQLDDQADLVGIGVVFSVNRECKKDIQSKKEDQWFVLSLPEESTAFQAGMRCGDIIVQALPCWFPKHEIPFWPT